MKYTIIVDKQSRTNPSNKKKQYEIDIEELRTDGTTYDSLVITREETYVMRRLKLSEYHVLTALEEPIKETLTELNIELFEGDNYIYLIDMVGNKFYAEYLIKNDFNDLYITWNEMNSAINQTAQQIDLSVNQKLEGYSTTQEMNASINMKANEIASTVQSNYATKEALNTAKSEIKQTTDNITSTVSKKVGNNEIVSKINQSSEQVKINANKIELSASDILNLLAGNTINLSGKNINISSNHFNVDGNGNVTIIDDGNTSSALIIKAPNTVASPHSTHVRSGDIFLYGPEGFIQLGADTGYSGGAIVVGPNESSANRTLIQNGNISCVKLTQTSLKSKKKNIKKLNINAIDLIKNSDICLYNLKGEKAKSKKHIGLVIGEGYNCPNEVISEDRQGVEQYSMTSLAWKAIQEQQEEIERLKQRIKKLEVQNGNSRI